MTKIVTISNEVKFEDVSILWGIQGLSKYIPDCEVITYTQDDLKYGRVDRDSDSLLYISAIGHAQHAGRTTKYIKERFPQSKIVGLASDTSYYIENNLGYQWKFSEDVFLHLDLMPQYLDVFKQQGITTDLWRWTISDKLLDTLLPLGRAIDYDRKKYTFIGVYHPDSITKGYRKHLVEYIRDHGLSFTRGAGSGHNDNNLEDLWEYYLDSWLCLETSSHNDPKLNRLGTQKGFRMGASIALGTPAVADNHPNNDTCLRCRGNYVPFYDFDNLDTLIDLGKYYTDPAHREEYEEMILIQQSWLKDYTIDKQLYQLLQKHNLL
jgi:hypothetical protein